MSVGHEVADGDAANAIRLGRQQHAIDHDRIAIGAEHARNGEAVDVGIDHTDLVTLRGQRDGEVGGDARLAHATLARRDEERACLRPGLSERNGATFGMAMRLAVSGRGSRVTVQLRSQFGVVHTIGDFVAQRTAGNGEGDEDADVSVGGNGDIAQHADVDDRAVEFGIFDGPQCVDDLLTSD